MEDRDFDHCCPATKGDHRWELVSEGVDEFGIKELREQCTKCGHWRIHPAIKFLLSKPVKSISVWVNGKDYRFNQGQMASEAQYFTHRPMLQKIIRGAELMAKESEGQEHLKAEMLRELRGLALARIA